eukprot:Clim_evm54s199 gene=Clim_evmTU54s199
MSESDDDDWESNWESGNFEPPPPAASIDTAVLEKNEEALGGSTSRPAHGAADLISGWGGSVGDQAQREEEAAQLKAEQEKKAKALKAAAAGKATKQQQQQRIPRNPPGVCGDFWRSGLCPRGMKCRFRHIRYNPDTYEESSSSASLVPKDPVPPFPEMVRRPKFRHQHDMRKFVMSLWFSTTMSMTNTDPNAENHLTATGATATEPDAVIATLVDTEKGPDTVHIKLRTIVSATDTEISPFAGTGLWPASFQRVALPLLHFLCDPAVRASPLQSSLRTIDAAVFDPSERFLDRCVRCVQDMITFDDSSGGSSSGGGPVVYWDTVDDTGDASIWQPEASSVLESVLAPVVRGLALAVPYYRAAGRDSDLKRLWGTCWDLWEALGSSLPLSPPATKQTTLSMFRAQLRQVLLWVRGRWAIVDLLDSDSTVRHRFENWVRVPLMVRLSDGGLLMTEHTQPLEVSDLFDSALYESLLAQIKSGTSEPSVQSFMCQILESQRHLHSQYAMLWTDMARTIQRALSRLFRMDAGQRHALRTIDTLRCSSLNSTENHSDTADVPIAVFHNAQLSWPAQQHHAVAALKPLSATHPTQGLAWALFDESRESYVEVPLRLSFAQITPASGQSVGAWWEHGAGSGLLEEGSLVCLVNNNAEETMPSYVPVIVRQKRLDSLSGHTQSASIVVSVYVREESSNTSGSSSHGFLDWTQVKKILSPDQKGPHHKQSSAWTLLQVRNHLFTAYAPILRSMQLMGSRVFVDAPWTGASVDPLFFEDVFATPDRQSSLQLAPQRLHAPTGANFERWLQNATLRLDKSQVQAVHHGLERSLALIQGPPGTGKTFVGVQITRQLLLKETEATAGSGGQPTEQQQSSAFHLNPRGLPPSHLHGSAPPILVICHTNHALDSFLHQLTASDNADGAAVGDRGVNAVLRLGSGSRSETFEGRTMRRVFAEAQELADVAHAGSHRDPLPLQRMQGKVFALLKDSEKDLLKAMSGVQRIGKPEDNAWRLWHRRVSLLRRWYELERCKQRAVLRSMTSELRIVGATTSGFALHRDLMAGLQFEVAICEEAGEVLECHTRIMLSPGLRHIILIGDHLQLRPKVLEYDLTADYWDHPKGRNGQEETVLDRSLFERLVREHDNDVMDESVLVTLQEQRRMRPEISAMLCQSLYPALRNASAVTDRKYGMHTAGLAAPLWFFDHGLDEADKGDAKESLGFNSKVNPGEAQWTVALLRYFLGPGSKQANSGKDTVTVQSIAVLTPYVGQLALLRREITAWGLRARLGEGDLSDEGGIEGPNGEGFGRPAAFTGSAKQHVQQRQSIELRLATVDNFQGEEADLVIISTVRSNSSGSLGFLRMDNRINVLLSRARYGMLVLCSANTIKAARKGDMLLFRKAIEFAERQKCIGNYVPIMHNSQVIKAKSVSDLPQ